MQNRCVTVVAGVSASGKSTFGVRYVLNAAHLAYRFIFDADLQYCKRLCCDSAGDDLDMAVQLIQGTVVFNPHVLYPGRLTDAFAFFCQFAFEHSQRLPGRKLLLVDEAWKYVSAQRYPQELANCVQTGRHHGLECMFLSQLPHKLNEAIRNECSELVCFRLGDANPLKWAQEKGLNPTELSALPRLHFVARNLDSGDELRGKLEL